MSKIYLNTIIQANIRNVFDLARDIDLHQQSTSKTNEKAIAGRVSGLMERGETVTWRAKHLGIYQTLTTKIIRMEKPHHFTDIMQKGSFKFMKHQHIFRQDGQSTIIPRPVFRFIKPYLGLLDF